METEDSESRSSRPTEPDDDLEVIDAENARRDWLAIGKQAETVWGIVAEMSETNFERLKGEDGFDVMGEGLATMGYLFRKIRGEE